MSLAVVDRPRGEGLTASALLAPATIFIALGLLAPLGFLLRYSLNAYEPTKKMMVEALTLANYVQFFVDPYYSAILWTTLRISVLVTLACLVLGFPLAYVLARTQSRYKNLLIIAIVLPLFVGNSVRAAGWMVVFGNKGFVNAGLMGLGLISTPIVLTPDYRALAAPVGILHAIKDSGAFKSGSTGADTIPELLAFGERIDYVTGKVGFNAFSDTRLSDVLGGRGIRDVLVAGMGTSLCIDSTGRAAYERGYNVTILSDCTSARTETEQKFFCENVFPLYGRAKTSREVLAELGVGA